MLLGFSVLVAALFWAGLHWWQRGRALGPEKLIPVLVLVGLLCRLLFVFCTPVFYAPDEESHYKYVQHLVEHRSFPVQSGKLGAAAESYEYNQPPLYYLLLTPLFWFGDRVLQHVPATVFLLRLCSVLLWGLNVWLARAWLRRSAVSDPFVAVFVMGIVCLLPTYVFIGAVINNDNLLTTLGAGLLCVMAGPERNFKWAGSLGLLLGLALWAKQSAVMFIPGIVLMIVAFAAQKQIPWLKALEYLGVALGLAGLVFLPRALWNLQTYGTFTPEFTILVPIPWPSLIHGLASTLHQVVKTFWATSGVTNNVGYPFPLAGMALMALCLLAQQEGVRLQRREPPAKLGPSSTMMGVLFVTVLVAGLLVLRFGYLSTMGQGRHLFPVLLPIGLMLAAGLRSLPLKRPELQATGFWVAYAVTFLAFSLSRFPAGFAGQ